MELIHPPYANISGRNTYVFLCSSIAKHNIVDVVGDDRAGRPMVVVYACRLPSNKTFDHQKFLRLKANSYKACGRIELLCRYLMHTLSKFVKQDYTILYFHYGLRSHNKPPIKWLMQAYKLLDRKYVTMHFSPTNPLTDIRRTSKRST